MAFEVIENLKKKYTTAVCPASGIRVKVRTLTRPAKTGGGEVRFIRVTIGALIARSISLVHERHNLKLAFGTDADAGKIQVSVDNTFGGFPATRDKSGNYSLTINSDTAEGLFALNFPEFTIEKCEAIRPENGKPPHFVFKASDAMLTVED
jgi:hypothetical protein